MKKRTIIALTLFLLLTTISSQQKLVISKFSIKDVQVENNFLIKENDIKKLLFPIYGKNLIFLKNEEIKRVLIKHTFVESFKVKKKYPNTLEIKIFEKKPFAILIKKKNKFYLSEKLELIEFKKLINNQEMPYIFGDEKKFEILYENLKKINFPLKDIKKYTLYETNRWDLEITKKRIIRLPSENYIKSLENYLELMNKKNLQKYKVFDYRINNQLILK